MYPHLTYFFEIAIVGRVVPWIIYKAVDAERSSVEIVLSRGHCFHTPFTMCGEVLDSQ
jgi:hypothetical protein